VCGDYAELIEISGDISCQSLGRKKEREEKKLYRNYSLKQSKSSSDNFIKYKMSGKE